MDIVVLNMTGYSGTFAAKGWRYCTKTSPFCMITQGPMLPITLVTGYGTKAGSYRSPSLQSHSYTQWFPCLKSFRRTWVTKNFQHPQTSSYLAHLGDRHLTLTYSMPVYRPWCHGRANAFTSTVTGLMCAICYLCAMYKLMLQPCTLWWCAYTTVSWIPMTVHVITGDV